MLRKPFLALMIALLLAPVAANAQDAEPVGTVSTGDDQVYRSYDNPNVYFDATVGILAFGTIYDNDTAASRGLDSTANVFAASLEGSASDEAGSAPDFEFGDLEEVEMPTIGDESLAHRLSLVMFGSFDGEYVLISVRQGAWLQVLVGFGFGDVDVFTELEALAGDMITRWPSEEPIAVREDGLRTGGIWNMMPVPEDISADFVLDDDFEEGPATESDEIVPAGSPAPVSDSGTPAAESTMPAGRDLPLLPTSTPESAQPEPTMPSGSEAGIAPATETPAPTAEPTPAPASTPAPSSRMAQPFDVTVEIVIPEGRYIVAEDGSCSGQGLLDDLDQGGTLTLRVANDGEQAAEVEFGSAGQVGYDVPLRQDACYFQASFTDVPARSGYSLLAGDSVIGRFTYEELSELNTVVVVIGDN
jgi:hypothetical protein